MRTENAASPLSPPIDIDADQWKIVREILQKNVPQHEVWAFGSRATRTAKPYSDLDLVVMTRNPLPLDAAASLREAFSESDLPWKVDICDWASTAGVFRRKITETHVVVQKGNRENLPAVEASTKTGCTPSHPTDPGHNT